MTQPSEDAIAKTLLKQYGKTFADEIGIDVSKNSPAPLFQLLCAAILFSTRIKSDLAVQAAKALIRHGWKTPQAMAESSWDERAKTLNEAGYARYDERTASMLGDTAQMVCDRYSGDLRQLRSEADCDPQQERKLLKEFKGMGDVGVDIFFREVQAAWDELFPFVDRRAGSGAKKLGLPDSAEKLSALVPQQDFTKLVAALVRVELNGNHEEVLSGVQS